MQLYLKDPAAPARCLFSTPGMLPRFDDSCGLGRISAAACNLVANETYSFELNKVGKTLPGLCPKRRELGSHQGCTEKSPEHFD